MNIAVYCGSSAGSKEAYTIGAVALGMWIAENGHTLVYGGARGGLMGTIANSVLSNAGKVIGVLPQVEFIQNRRHQFFNRVHRYERYGGAESENDRVSRCLHRTAGWSGNLRRVIGYHIPAASSHQ